MAKNRRLYMSDLHRIRSRMRIGQKAIIHEKDGMWPDKMVKVQAVICALNENTFTVKRQSSCGYVTKESFKYVDLFMKDGGIEVC